MHDEELLYYSLKRIASTIERIIDNSKAIDDSQYYLLFPAGMERLESTCMLLLAIGESIKGIDKMTQKQLLSNYPEVDWKGVMGIRDIIAHHYFDIDESIVFDVVKNKLPGMLETINKMIDEIGSNNIVVFLTIQYYFLSLRHE
ncbi:HepT-like ribonuclease domain-containing protein [Leyella stercorea]|uniref:HepT-like ribonuclease domain-containing protein n=2 Tax=Leyella stercorea TaxID=363265 RepID=UPI00242E9416|nr:HepT-like ribonuclease domain-containing protein [Leyella stercorea]